MIRVNAVLLALLAVAGAELPKELDPFLEVLFDVKECDSFLSGDYTTVGTLDCSPYTCDFPRQVCMRPNSKYQEASANECRAVPMDCLVAANGGEPVGPPQIATVAPSLITMPMVINKPRKEHGGFLGGSKVQPTVINPMDICDMEAPDGRFCGFKVMYTYNKETLQCDEFWFPGCTTAETNANLFSDMHSCNKLAEMCRRSAVKPSTTQAPFTFFPPLPTTTQPPLILPPPSTTWSPLPPPPPTAPPGFGGLMGGLGHKQRPQGKGRGGLGGAGGGRGGPKVGGMGGMGGMGGLGGMAGLMGGGGGGGGGPFGTFPGLGSALGGPAPTVAPGTGDGEDLGLLGLIQQGLKDAQAIRQGGPQGKEAAAAAAGKILQQFTGFDLNNLGGNFGGLFGG